MQMQGSEAVLAASARCAFASCVLWMSAYASAYVPSYIPEIAGMTGYGLFRTGFPYIYIYIGPSKQPGQNKYRDS